MDAILTHENADFDALAALLGAKKIYSDAISILPRRMNRNVRDFCALYCDALPFTRPDDLPRQHFRDVVIVDSQGVQSARGVTPKTRVHFIDHHPLARELKPGMTFSGGETGATTTLFVEQIRAKELALTPIEATLLLLGIYEDTGALCYVTTTPRDARATAFLLERGASLAVVNDFFASAVDGRATQIVPPTDRKNSNARNRWARDCACRRARGKIHRRSFDAGASIARDVRSRRALPPRANGRSHPTRRTFRTRRD
jgi:tRNA nucleotidyltransferase (CCA-adding enzyme)